MNVGLIMMLSLGVLSDKAAKLRNIDIGKFENYQARNGSVHAVTEFGVLPMNEEKPNIVEEHQSGKNDDWENRVLCSDGNCIGVIGPNGHCKECGKPFEGELPKPNQDTTEPPDMRPQDMPIDKDNQDMPIDKDNEEEETDVDAAAQTDGSDWDSRVLCSDGNCIGVIGPNGRCKECGKLYREGADE